ncbi:MAG: metalloregulator ArsR/SmtB family transcription factor [Planctomycetota bacterium]
MVSVTKPDSQTACTPSEASERHSPLDEALDAEVFKALAEPTRLKLLACLVKCGREASVTEVAACCAVDFSVVARHLSQLARAGLLENRKEGRAMLYRADTERLAGLMESWASAFRASAPLVGEGCRPPDEETAEPACEPGCCD